MRATALADLRSGSLFDAWEVACTACVVLALFLCKQLASTCTNAMMAGSPLPFVKPDCVRKSYLG